MRPAGPPQPMGPGPPALDSHHQASAAHRTPPSYNPTLAPPAVVCPSPWGAGAWPPGPPRRESCALCPSCGRPGPGEKNGTAESGKMRMRVRTPGVQATQGAAQNVRVAPGMGLRHDGRCRMGSKRVAHGAKEGLCCALPALGRELASRRMGPRLHMPRYSSVPYTLNRPQTDCHERTDTLTHLLQQLGHKGADLRLG